MNDDSEQTLLAAKYRRLARAISDATTEQVLLQMAADCDEKVRLLQCRMPPAHN